MAAYFTEWSWYCTCETLKRILDCFSVARLACSQEIYMSVLCDKKSSFWVIDSFLYEAWWFKINALGTFSHLLNYFALFGSSDPMGLNYWTFLNSNVMTKNERYFSEFPINVLDIQFHLGNDKTFLTWLRKHCLMMWLEIQYLTTLLYGVYCKCL